MNKSSLVLAASLGLGACEPGASNGRATIVDLVSMGGDWACQGYAIEDTTLTDVSDCLGWSGSDSSDLLVSVGSSVSSAVDSELLASVEASIDEWNRFFISYDVQGEISFSYPPQVLNDWDCQELIDDIFVFDTSDLPNGVYVCVPSLEDWNAVAAARDTNADSMSGNTSSQLHGVVGDRGLVDHALVLVDPKCFGEKEGYEVENQKKCDLNAIVNHEFGHAGPLYLGHAENELCLMYATPNWVDVAATVPTDACEGKAVQALYGE